MSHDDVPRRWDPSPSPDDDDPADPGPASPDEDTSFLMPKYLPLGSVVVLRNGEKRLLIFGRRQKDTANPRVFDYVGVPYPEGNIMPKATFLFNHEDIARIFYLGYADEEEEAWVARLNALPPEGSPLS